MIATAPHYLLLSETQNFAGDSSIGGCWRFVLQKIDGSEQLEVSDREPDVSGERLQLLTVLRGLEALDQPSRVTIVTSSRYVIRGVRCELTYWRDNDWMWERFGEMKPIKNADLWRRTGKSSPIPYGHVSRLENQAGSNEHIRFNGGNEKGRFASIGRLVGPSVCERLCPSGKTDETWGDIREICRRGMRLTITALCPWCQNTQMIFY